MKYDAETLPVCPDCAERDGVDDEATKLCERCGIKYCTHFASSINFRYCGNCLVDFHIVESVETKIIEYRNESGEVTSRKRSMARNLKLTGTDWLFAQTAILNLSDEELLETIEYHRNIASLMLLERETRRTEHFQKLSKIKIIMPKRDDVDATGAIKKTKKGSATTKTDKKKVAKEPDQNAIAAALATLLSAHLTPEQIMALGAKGKK